MQGLKFLCWIYMCVLLSPRSLAAQDQIFLRNENQVIYCYILHADDSLIIFRSAEPADSSTYEISLAETYGFLLEDPIGKEVGPQKSSGMILRLSHPEKTRSHTFRENSGIIFRIRNDSIFMPRRGKITRITNDSIEIETRINRRKDRYTFAIKQIEQFGYTTGLSELLSLIVFPFPTGKSEADFFYRKMPIENGWKYQVLSDIPHKIKKHRRWKRIRPEGAIRRKSSFQNKK